MNERPCRYTVADLRKAITAMRKQKGFNAPSKGVLDNLLDSHRFLLHAEGIHDVGALLSGTIKQKRAVWKRLKEKYHPAVGSMTSAQCTQLIYATNKHLKYNYDPKLRAFTEKKMVTKACRASSPPDFKSLASADALPMKTQRTKAPPALALDLDDDLDIDDAGERQGKSILEESDEEQEMSDFDDTPPSPPVRRKAKQTKKPFKVQDVDTMNYVQFAAYIRRLRDHHGKSKPKQEQLSRWWKIVKEKKESRARETEHINSMKQSERQSRALEKQSQRAQRDKSKAERSAANKADRIASQRTDLGKIPKKKKN